MYLVFRHHPPPWKFVTRQDAYGDAVYAVEDANGNSVMTCSHANAGAAAALMALYSVLTLDQAAALGAPFDPDAPPPSPEA